MTGDNLTLTVDGTVVISTFDSSITAAGLGGVGYHFAFGGSSTLPLWTAWEIECATGFGNARSSTGSLAAAPHLSGTGTLTVLAITGTGSLSVVPHFISTIPSVSDTFTDTNGTTLPSHTADTGQSWTRTSDSDASTSGDLVITNNRVALAASPSSVGGRATIDVSGSGTPKAIIGSLLRVQAGDSFPTLWLRAQNATRTGYALRYLATTGGQWELHRWSSGSDTTLGVTSGVSILADGDHSTITLGESAGSGGSLDLNITVITPSETTNLTLNDSSPLAAGAPGLSMEDGATSTEIKVWDSITVTF
jgi:hypothetical protein